MAVHSRRVRTYRLVCENLESRITPSAKLIGPYSAQELLSLTEARADSYSLYSTVPESPKDAKPALTLSEFQPFKINFDSLRSHLADAPKEFETEQTKTLAIPRPDGTFQRFNVWEVAMMEPELAAQFPDIKTWRGEGIDDPTATLSADLTPHGFHAQILSPQGRWYVDPYYHLDSSVYASYFPKDLANPNGARSQDDLVLPPLSALDASRTTTDDQQTAGRASSGATLRIYRAAVAATGEYTAFFGGTKPLGQAAIVTAMNRVSGIYETELAIRMVLVGNNVNIVYTSAASDPYTNDDGFAMLDENQTNVDAMIGNANYDIGHVFSTGGGGVAGLGVVGQSGFKAQGVTGSPSPTGDAFYVDYVAHEVGHQYGGNHTFNGVNGSAGGGNRYAPAAYEPGSGSTIMAYAGICGADDLQSNSDAYFHAESLDEISDFVLTSGAGGNTQTATGNNIPTANAGADRAIPALTTFALTGSGTDADAGDTLTYNWEQYDLGPARALGSADNGLSPLFRSFNSSTNPTRYFPSLPLILSNTSSSSEILPTVAHSGGSNLTFRLTVRDNRATGAYNRDDMNITVVATGSAFAVTAPNTAVSFSGGSAQTVTWNVAGTTASPISAANVDILLSTDGGLTFPSVLLAGTANDGTQAVTIPNVGTTQARIKVQPSNNIFFDIGNANFTIIAVPKTTNVTSSVANNSYGAGASIPISVTLSAAVNVTGFPQIALNSGGTATYASGTGSATLIFNHTVGAGQNSADLDYSSVAALTLNGGTIKAVSNGADVDLALPAPAGAGSLGFNKNIVVNTTDVPVISSISSTAGDGTYGTGSVIPITIQFDRAVTVTGIPLLALNSSGSAVASYSTGSGSSTLTFNYTVAVGEASSDLDYDSTTALTLNGGTIINQITSTPATLTLPSPGSANSLGDNKNLVIDTTAVGPTVVEFRVKFGKKWYNLIGSPRFDLPWRINGIQVVFSEPIVSGKIQSLTGVTATKLSGLKSNTLTWKIRSLAKGSFNTSLVAGGPNALKNGAGTLISGFSQAFKVLLGDYDDNGIVNLVDETAIRTGVAKPYDLHPSGYNIFADLSGDGLINLVDVGIVKSRKGTSLP